MTDLVDTTEMYLKAILELEEERIVPLRARIAERLHHSGPTVSQTVARMERDGLVVVSGDRHLELTELGRERATSVMRKHRLAERLLSDVIKLDWPYVHDEACRWEHVMSEQVEERIFNLLGRPEESPYGNPIPGLEAFGGHKAREFTEGMVNLADAMARYQPEFRVVIGQLSERIQIDPELLGQLEEAGLTPGAEVSLKQVGDYIAVQVPGVEGALELPQEVAVHVFVVVGGQ